MTSVNQSIAEAGGLPGQVGEHYMRRCKWCNNKTRQHISHVDDHRPFYALCEECLPEFMSQEKVWKESGESGGTGYLWRDDYTGPWTFQKWKVFVPTDRTAAVARLEQWSKTVSVVAPISAQKPLAFRQYAMIQCSKCHTFHNQSGWTGDICDDCEDAKMKCSKCSVFTGADYFIQPKGGVYCKKCHLNTQIGEAAKKPIQSKGEVRRLPKANSPMWTEQWSCQGSGKEPYIISRKSNGANGSTTEEGFACSCPAFTRNVPREDCKHILKVKLFEGMSTAAKAVVPAAHAKEYAEFLKLKAKQGRAAATDPNEIKMVGDTTGRKFR
jgi:hypothetical protein